MQLYCTSLGFYKGKKKAWHHSEGEQQGRKYTVTSSCVCVCVVCALILMSLLCSLLVELMEVRIPVRLNGKDQNKL